MLPFQYLNLVPIHVNITHNKHFCLAKAIRYKFNWTHIENKSCIYPKVLFSNYDLTKTYLIVESSKTRDYKIT